MEFRSQPLRQSPRFAFRKRASAVVLIAIAVVFVGRVAWLTTVQGDRYAEAAEDNLQSLRRLEAPRGNILDRNGEPLALNRKAYSITFSRYRLSRAEVAQSLRDLGELLDEDLSGRVDEIMETRPSWTRHRLARHLTQSQVVPILERPEDFLGMRVAADFQREYPHGSAMAPVLGFLGKIQPAEVEIYTRPLYLPDAYVGRMGLEAQYEDRLVGKPGRERLRRDARGRLLADPNVEQPARPGDDLVLTIDQQLQEFAFEKLGPDKGSVVVMDVGSGEVLALVSSPSFDPERPWLSEIADQPVSYLNRSVQGGYPPASTFKLVSASAALKANLSPTETRVCRGHYELPGWGRPYWCDARSGHGPTNLHHAIQWSCNAYFYEVAHEIGGDRILAAARDFGFGDVTGIDLPGERAGALMKDGKHPNDGETLNIAIGQGALIATPLQVAVAYAALANGGELVRPRVVREIHPGDGRAAEMLPTRTNGRISLSTLERQRLIAAFYDVVNAPGGTAYRVGFEPHWEVCGKTGTAENGRGGLDAWFAAFYPRSAPRYVVITHLEEADAHGGEVAAPLARDIIAFQHGEYVEPTESDEMMLSDMLDE
ncbi:penicillin-binding protein 2 [bacterium]|nr:penicillin-binding protein 2 [bacterium]